MTDTVTAAVQGLWLLASVAGLVFAAGAAREAHEDLKAATSHNGAKRLLAAANLRAQLFRSSKLAAFALAATVAVLRWPGDDEPRRLVIVVLVTYAVLATATDAILDRLARRRIIAYLERQRR